MAGSSAWQARGQARAHGKVRRGVGASAGRPTVRDEPGHPHHRASRTSACAADRPRPRGRRPPGGRVQVAGQRRAAHRPSAPRPRPGRDVRSHARPRCAHQHRAAHRPRCAQRPGRTHPVASAGGAHLPQHRTKPRVASPPVEAQAGNSTVRGLTASPTRACFRVRARAHARVQRSFGPTRLCAGARGRHQSLSHSIPAHAGPAKHPAAAPRPPSSAPPRARARADVRATRASVHVARTALGHEAHAR